MPTKNQIKYWDSLRGKKPKNMNGLLLGQGWNKGRRHPIKTRKKLSASHKGQKPWNKGKKMLSISGVNHWQWRGGKSKHIGNNIRKSPEYRCWREAVYKRDRFTCQKYGIIGGRLVAHHIKNFAEYPELRFAIDNGITLSRKAHNEFHKKYGLRHNTPEQLKEFLHR